MIGPVHKFGLLQNTLFLTVLRLNFVSSLVRAGVLSLYLNLFLDVVTPCLKRQRFLNSPEGFHEVDVFIVFVFYSEQVFVS